MTELLFALLVLISSAVIVVLLFAVHVVAAGAEINQETRGENAKLRTSLAALEEAARPCLAVECKQESGLRLGHGRERESLAYLEVHNLRGGQVQNAYARVQVVEHEHASSGGARPYKQRLYKHQDVFLKWEATDDRLHTFNEAANLYVARGRSGDGRYALVSAGKTQLFPPLQTSTGYELLIDIAADALPVFHARLHLRMTNYLRTAPDGTPIWDPSIPYTVEFREWTEADEVAGEMDVDAWREEHNA